MTRRVEIIRSGRIRRQVLKAIRDNASSELVEVAFNGIGDIKALSHQLKCDSNDGPFDGMVTAEGDALFAIGSKVRFFNEIDPMLFPLGEFDSFKRA